MTKKIISVIALLAIGFVLGVMGGRVATFGGAGGSVEYSAKTFVGDVYQGMTSVLMFQKGLFVGPITSSQPVTLSGTNTLSGATTVSGAAVLSGNVNISAASSTLKIGNTTSGLGTGCLVLGNSAGATSSPVYITATGTTITATTTQPSICK